MDENYYRSLIDKVRKNEEKMWRQNESPEEGFDDFAKLWDIINDDEATVSSQTYFEAMEICMTSFFGTIQDPKIVWDNIVDHYQRILNGSDIGEFRDAFTNFAEIISRNQYPDCEDQFKKMMRMAIDTGDWGMATAITACAYNDYFYDDLWPRNNEYAEWNVWCAVFSDMPFESVPHCPEAQEAINELYSKFGAHPEAHRLRELYDEIDSW
jgi:hypothetical protein